MPNNSHLRHCACAISQSLVRRCSFISWVRVRVRVRFNIIPTSRANLVLRVIWLCDIFDTTPAIGCMLSSYRWRHCEIQEVHAVSLSVNFCKTPRNNLISVTPINTLLHASNKHVLSSVCLPPPPGGDTIGRTTDEK